MAYVPLWDEANEGHIARHNVTPSEVEEVLSDPRSLGTPSDGHRAGRVVVWGCTAAGRPLVVFLDRPTPSGLAYVVTARPMTARELRSYEEATP